MCTCSDTYARIAPRQVKRATYAACGPLNSRLSTGSVDNNIVRCGGHAGALCRPWVPTWGLPVDQGR